MPADIKAVYRTVWDLNPIDLIDMAADRAPFIDQSQSLTLGVRHPTPALMVRSSVLSIGFGPRADRVLYPFTERSDAACLACRSENWPILSPYATSCFHGAGGGSLSRRTCASNP